MQYIKGNTCKHTTGIWVAVKVGSKNRGKFGEIEGLTRHPTAVSK